MSRKMNPFMKGILVVGALVFARYINKHFSDNKVDKAPVNVSRQPVYYDFHR